MTARPIGKRAYHRADDCTALPGERQRGDNTGELAGRRRGRNERAHRRRTEAPRCAVERSEHEEGRDARRTISYVHRETDEHRNLERVDDGDDSPTIEAVGHNPGDQDEGDARKKLSETEQAQVELPPLHLEDLNTQRRDGGHAAERSEGHRQDTENGRPPMTRVDRFGGSGSHQFFRRGDGPSTVARNGFTISAEWSTVARTWAD